jgi:hypothetical protein
MTRKAKTPKPAKSAAMSEARRESAELLNLDPDDLSPAGALRCDMVTALRLVIDDELARAQSSSNADLGKLSTAVAQLQTILREANPTEPDDGIPAIYRQDPKRVLEDIVQRWIEADETERAERGLSPRISSDDAEALQARVDELEQENARLRSPGANHGFACAVAASDRVIDPPTGDIVPPGEQSDNPANMRPPVGTQPKPVTTIDGKPLRPGMGPDGKPIPPQARSGAETKAAMERVNADRATTLRIMTEPSRVKGEPVPSTGPRIVSPYEGGPWRRAW